MGELTEAQRRAALGLEPEEADLEVERDELLRQLYSLGFADDEITEALDMLPDDLASEVALYRRTLGHVRRSAQATAWTTTDRQRARQSRAARTTAGKHPAFPGPEPDAYIPPRRRKQP
jgi:hypothetical protein